MAMGAKKNAQLRVLATAFRTLRRNLFGRVSTGQRQLKNFAGPGAEFVELLPGCRIEIVQVHRSWHWQGRDQVNPQIQCLFGHEPVRTLGKRRHDTQPTARVLLAK